MDLPPVEQRRTESDRALAVQDAVIAPPEKAPAPANLLPAYLAERDVPCVHCGYNLRGAAGSSCPECGKKVELGLLGSARFAGHGLFVLVALLWVLLAGGMNAARKAHEVYGEAVAGALSQQVLVFSSGSVTLNGRVVSSWSTSGPAGGVGGGGGRITIAPGTPAARGAAGGGAAGVGAGALLNLMPSGAVTAGTSTSRDWTAVSAQQWWLLGWWSGLALLAAIGLAAYWILRRRKRQPSVRATRAVVGLAGLLFACYAAYHVQMFARDVASWW